LETVTKEFLTIESKRTQDARSNHAENAIRVAYEQFDCPQAVTKVKGRRCNKRFLWAVHAGPFMLNPSTRIIYKC
jgi:hypothetical protein